MLRLLSSLNLMTFSSKMATGLQNHRPKTVRKLLYILCLDINLISSLTLQNHFKKDTLLLTDPSTHIAVEHVEYLSWTSISGNTVIILN